MQEYCRIILAMQEYCKNNSRAILHYSCNTRIIQEYSCIDEQWHWQARKVLLYSCLKSDLALFLHSMGHILQSPNSCIILAQE